MSYVMVVPSIHRPWTEACLEHCRLEPFIVDNTETNRGVAASWNLAADRMIERRADWLILCSAAIRFNRDFGGLDVLDALERHGSAYAVEAGLGLGWHLIAFHRRAFELVGRFDENFWPAYFEDNDFARRLIVALDGRSPEWPKVTFEVGLQGFSHGVELGGARIDPGLLRRYYLSKWGGPPAEERFARPFDTAVPLWWWPQPCGCSHPEMFHDEQEGPCQECSCSHYTPRGTA